MHPSIYDQTSMAQLADLHKACELAMDMMSNNMLRAAGGFVQSEGLAPGEFAIGNWIVRPRFPEDSHRSPTPRTA